MFSLNRGRGRRPVLIGEWSTWPALRFDPERRVNWPQGRRVLRRYSGMLFDVPLRACAHQQVMIRSSPILLSYSPCGAIALQVNAFKIVGNLRSLTPIDDNCGNGYCYCLKLMTDNPMVVGPIRDRVPGPGQQTNVTFITSR